MVADAAPLALPEGEFSGQQEMVAFADVDNLEFMNCAV